MKKTGSRAILMIALAATLVATYYAPGDSNDTVVVPARIESRAEALRRSGTTKTHLASVATGEQEAPEMVRLDRPRATSGESEKRSRLFEPQSWVPVAVSLTTKTQAAPKPPSAISAAAPVYMPAPSAPPIPFRALGWYDDEGRRGVFIQHQGQNLVVHVGDKIGADYAVEAWTDRTLNLRYLPLNQLQTLEVGSYGK